MDLNEQSWGLDSGSRWRNRSFRALVQLQFLLEHNAAVQRSKRRSHRNSTRNGPNNRHLRDSRTDHLPEYTVHGLVWSSKRNCHRVYSRRNMWGIRENSRKRIAPKSRLPTPVRRLPRFQLYQSIFWWNYRDEMLNHIFDPYPSRLQDEYDGRL